MPRDAEGAELLERVIQPWHHVLRLGLVLTEPIVGPRGFWDLARRG